ncbi:hypothetical protein NQ318_013047 [Aromia moschata]|uniref:Uncharacterized protein n=1 Tax=Aromia moschata TaxID=1265417 RepID=A0AAV8XLR8_9CUCU|nr:hypothetical protein NQ318_013047 [Aromia moschata]
MQKCIKKAKKVLTLIEKGAILDALEKKESVASIGRKYGINESSLEEEKLEEASNAGYNVTACCVEAQLNSVCLPLCSYNAKMTDIKLLAGVCGGEFQKILRCGAGGRNHGACCNRRGVPSNCLSLCSGVILDSLLITATTCVPYIGNIAQCFEEGTGNLPGPVSALHGVVVDEKSILLEWSPPENSSTVTDYVIHYQKVDNTSMHETLLKLDNQINTTSTTQTITGLEENQMYHIFVVARNENGTSLPSSIIVINLVKSDQSKWVNGVPSPPHSLAVASHSATWVTITWQPPEFSHPSEIITYRLYHKSTVEEQFQIKNCTVTSYMIASLNPNTQYIVYVQAVTDKGVSMPSETLIAWTDPAYPAFVEPPTVHPINLVLEGSSMTVLCIAMGTPMPTISLYISGRLVRQDTTRHMVTVIHNVTKDMDQISCYADNGYGTPMQAAKLPGPPQNVRIEFIDAHSIYLVWDPPLKNPHTVEQYRVFWRSIDSTSSHRHKGDTSDTRLKITDLKAGTTYEAVVKAGNSKGTSSHRIVEIHDGRQIRNVGSQSRHSGRSRGSGGRCDTSSGRRGGHIRRRGVVCEDEENAWCQEFERDRLRKPQLSERSQHGSYPDKSIFFQTGFHIGFEVKKLSIILKQNGDAVIYIKKRLCFKALRGRHHTSHNYQPRTKNEIYSERLEGIVPIFIHFNNNNNIIIIPFISIRLLQKKYRNIGYNFSVSQGQNESATVPNGTANGVAVSSASGGQGWKNEALHVPAQQEVNPTLYEELKLGQDGAGFKRLKP